MPLQRVVDRDALTNEPLPMIDQQPQVEFRSFELRGGQPVEPFAQRSPGDGDRVDAVGLPALAAAAACVSHQPRRDPQHTLSPLDQETLERSRHVPAVLERPGSLIIELAGPAEQRLEPADADLDRPLAEHLARRCAGRGDRVRALVHVRPENNHPPRPPSLD